MFFSKRSMLKGLGFILLVAVCNLHLLENTTPAVLMFLPGSVAIGEWWRIVSHAFVHVSWYHLLLNVFAVVLLWTQMQPLNGWLRLFLACGCGLGSLVGAAFFSPVIEQTGFCGLSGVAHGMMCLVGLHWLIGESKSCEKLSIIPGFLLVVISVGKSVYEVLGGTALLGGVHFGDLGVPIVQSHLGGVVGGCVALIMLKIRNAATGRVMYRPLLSEAAQEGEP